MAGVQIDGVNNKIDFDDDQDTSISSNTDDTLVFEAGGTDTMTIINGKVGMGTASPSTNLHIFSTADNAPHLLLENFQDADTDDAAVIELYLNDQTTGGIGDNTDVGVIRFTGDEKDSGTKETYAEIRGVAHDPGSGSGNRGNLSFFVQSAGTLTETMTLDETVVTISSGSKITYGDGGTTSRLMADEWRITSSLAGGSGTIFTANWERNDTNFSLVGTGMTESSGEFTFPSTGVYYIIARSRVSIAANLGNVKIGISMTTDNSSYSSIALGSAFSDGDDNNSTMFCSAMVDITNTSTHKVKMAYAGADSNVDFQGSSTQMYTGLTFLRLGDT